MSSEPASRFGELLLRDWNSGRLSVLDRGAALQKAVRATFNLVRDRAAEDARNRVTGGVRSRLGGLDRAGGAGTIAAATVGLLTPAH